MVGTDHRRAAVEMRERLAFDPVRMEAALRGLAAHAREGVILSTCNRTEVYAVVEGGAGEAPSAPLFRFLGEHCRASSEDLAAATTVRDEREAISHLFRVSCGLESLVMGEPQILGQLRDALAAARAAGAAGPTLTRLATDALRVGKQARSLTGIARNRLTIPHAALSLASAHIGGLRGKDALVVGAGEMGDLTAKLLRSAGVRSLTVANRSVERAATLVAATGGQAVGLDGLPDALSRSDVAFGAAGASRYLVGPETVVARGSDGTSPLVLVDMAVPRTFDPDLASLDGVRLFDVDDLARPAASLQADYEAEVARVETLVADAIDGFVAWRAGRGAAPTIAALRRSSEEIRTGELERALARLGHLSERDRDVVAALSVGIVSKLLHRPMTRLQTADGQRDVVAAAESLFGLNGAVAEHVEEPS